MSLMAALFCAGLFLLSMPLALHVCTRKNDLLSRFVQEGAKRDYSDKNHTYYLTNMVMTETNFLERVPAVIGQKTGYTMDRWLVHHRTVN